MTSLALLALALSAAEPCTDARVLPLGELGSVSRERARVLELAGLAPLRPRVFERWSSDLELHLCEGEVPHPSKLSSAEPQLRPELGLAPFTLRAVGHGGWPDDRNDGALWAGRGLSSSLSGGVRMRWMWFSAQLAPQLSWQENRSFAVLGTGAEGPAAFANPFVSGIDLPVRYGPGAFWTSHPGQSWIRADVFNVAAGFSTENLWWGPALRDPILMSNSAPGFPHVFLGTSRPQDVWLGFLEVQAVWGHLRESNWFDTDPLNDKRLFTALNLGFEPKVVPGLTVGLIRSFLFTIPPGGVSWSRYLRPFFESYEKVELGSDEQDARGDNQLTSVFARWAHQPVGFEVYGEWGRDDHAWDWSDFVTHPGHGQAYQLGLQKAWRGVRGGVLRLSAELVNTFETPAAKPPRGVPIFYTHGIARQGYTHEGQMLGASLGPAGNAQSLSVDWFGPRARVGLFVERRLRNQRYFYDNVSTLFEQDVELAADLRYSVTLGDFEVDARLGAARRLNAFFGESRSAPRGSLAVTWTPGPLLAPTAPARR